jgi:FkbM family methyltransferase
MQYTTMGHGASTRKKWKRASTYLRYGGPLLLLQSLSYLVLERDIVTPPLVPLYRRLSGVRGGTISYAGVTFDASAAPITDDVLADFLTSYELAERILIDQHIPSDCDVLEIGAGIGFISCYVDQRLDADRDHVVVEANPELIDVIEDTKRRNGCEFEVLNAAYAVDDESVTFAVRDQFLSSQTVTRSDGPQEQTQQELVTVPGVGLQQIRSRFDLDDVVVILDIEGDEHDLIRKEAPILAVFCQMLFVELHGSTEAITESINRLLESGFVQLDHHGDVYVFQR